MDEGCHVTPDLTNLFTKLKAENLAVLRRDSSQVTSPLVLPGSIKANVTESLNLALCSNSCL